MLQPIGLMVERALRSRCPTWSCMRVDAITTTAAAAEWSGGSDAAERAGLLSTTKARDAYDASAAGSSVSALGEALSSFRDGCGGCRAAVGSSHRAGPATTIESASDVSASYSWSSRSEASAHVCSSVEVESISSLSGSGAPIPACASSAGRQFPLYTGYDSKCEKEHGHPGARGSLDKNPPGRPPPQKRVLWQETQRLPQQFLASSPSRCGVRLYSGLVRAVLAGIALLIAVGVPDFARIVALIGAAFSFIISVVFPCVCYLRIFWAQLSAFQRSLNAIIVVVFSGASVLGIYATFSSRT